MNGASVMSEPLFLFWVVELAGMAFLYLCGVVLELGTEVRGGEETSYLE